MYIVDGTVPSVVFDMGTHTSKAGTAGEDLPHVLFPASVGYIDESDAEMSDAERRKRKYFPGSRALLQRTDHMEVGNPFDVNGIIHKWEMFESQIQHTLETELVVNPKELGVMIAEPTHNGKTEREKLCELLIEKCDVAAVYLAKAPVLAAYANGRTTGLIVDIGHSGTSVVPVYEGAVVKNRHLRTPVAGALLTKRVEQLVASKNVPLRPLYSFKKVFKSGAPRSRDENSEDDAAGGATMDPSDCQVEDVSFPNTTASYEKYCQTLLAEEVKEALCRANEAPLENLEIPHVSYELPDGNTVEFSEEKFLPPEMLFGKLLHCAGNPAMDIRASLATYQPTNALGQSSSGGLAGLVQDTVSRCDSSAHRDLLSNICLTGGSSVIPGVFERLSQELSYKFGRPPKIVAASGTPERRFCAWTGGSILATFSEFQKMWFSKEEYDENGAAFVHKKCV